MQPAVDLVSIPCMVIIHAAARLVHGQINMQAGACLQEANTASSSSGQVKDVGLAVHGERRVGSSQLSVSRSVRGSIHHAGSTTPSFHAAGSGDIPCSGQQHVELQAPPQRAAYSMRAACAWPTK
ncbi:hypothetical protein Dimus_007555, partial [Dionaea muscipula]